MKKLSISLIALAALALGACTSDDVALENKASNVEIGGDGYVSLAINLPTTPTTRAANDVYDDGLASEYAVQDATLLLFAGSDEASAAYYAQYDLSTTFKPYETTTDNITSRSQVTQQIDTPSDATANIYALVVLNDNGILAGTISAGATLSSLQSTMVNLGGVSAMTNKGFFMCNAPLISAKGGSSDPKDGVITTLAEIDQSKIFDSEAEAKANPATEIYVERGMAKVTVADATTSSSGLTATVLGFALDLTNNVTYLVRNTTSYSTWLSYYNGSSEVAATDKYRFAGSVEVGAGLYRTYWAEDPNYSSAPYVGGTEGNRDYGQIMDHIAGTTFANTGLGDENPQYCLENTFNLAHQNQDETTRAIIKIELNNGDDFYTWDGDKSTLYVEADVLAKILTAFQADGYVEQAEPLWLGGLDNNLYSHVHVAFTSDAASDDLTFTITYDDEDGEGINADNFLGGELPAVFDETSDVYAAVVAELNSEHQVAFYEDGISYYPVMIKHFGDDLTPWDITKVGTTTSYPDGNTNYGGLTGESNWLGRYGVLRNNWYDVQVTAVNNIGSATVPEAYGDVDDPVESWISIEINILSWAKRTQDVTL